MESEVDWAEWRENLERDLHAHLIGNDNTKAGAMRDNRAVIRWALIGGGASKPRLTRHGPLVRDSGLIASYRARASLISSWFRSAHAAR